MIALPAKGWGRGECGLAKHGPDTEPGSRVTGAGPHTRSRHQGQTGQADGAPASHQHRRPADWALPNAEVTPAGSESLIADAFGLLALNELLASLTRKRGA